MEAIETPYMMGLKIRMYPNRKQEQIFWKNIWAAKFIYNQLIRNSYEDAAIHRNKLDQRYPIPKACWKTGARGGILQSSKVRPKGLARITADRYPWLADPDLDSDMPNNTLIHYRHAWNLFHKVHTAGTPKFKRKSAPTKGYSTSNRYNSKQVAKTGGFPNLYNGSSVRFVDAKHLKLPKVGTVKVKLTRALPTNHLVRIATTTIKHEADGHWYVSLLLKSNELFQQPAPQTGKQVGIDLNTENFLTDSEGEMIANPRYYRTIKGKLAKQQRILARRQRRAKKAGRKLWQSKNYQHQKQKVAQLHAKIRHQRQNFLHVISTALIKNHDLVVAENLKSKNILRNHAMAMSISDVGWRAFLTMLEYKAPLYGRIFVEVNPAYTTQQCHDCGFRMGTDGTPKLTLADRQWICPHCGVSHVRDHNAAQNILSKGHQELAKPLTDESPIYK